MSHGNLRLLQLVIREESFIGAATAAGISQSAVSQAMRAIAVSSGVELFVREGRRMMPTRLARALASHVDKFEADIAETVVSSKLLRIPEDGLRVGISAGAALIYGPALTAAWHSSEAKPRGLMTLRGGDAADLLSSLKRGSLDVVIAPKPRLFELDRLRVDALYTSTPAVWARTDHPLRTGLKLKRTLSDLVGVDWIIVGGENTPGEMVREAFRVRKIGVPRVAVQCRDYATCLNLLAHTDLMAVVPHDILVDANQRQLVRAVRLMEGLPTYEVAIFRRSEGQPRMVAAIESVVSKISTALNSQGPTLPGPL